MTSIPFWNRLSTRLGVLILLIVLVLAGATAILVVRGFNLVEQDAQQALALLGQDTNSDLSDIITSTVVNLLAVFLLTLVGATVFSRSLLTEPINSLVDATQEVAGGNLGVTLPVTSNSELGMLANAFNDMSTSLASRTQELVMANEALRRSEADLEGRIQERTKELMALLDLSNGIALTTEDIPLIRSIFDELGSVIDFQAIAVYELIGQNNFQVVVERDEMPLIPQNKLLDAVSQKQTVTHIGALSKQVIFPIFVHNKTVGVLVLDVRKSKTLSDEKMRLTTAFANQAGVAIENMKLYTDVQEKAAFDERQHLARELHDSVSQALYSIVLGSHAAQKQLHKDPEQAGQALDYVQNLAEAGLAEMRALIFELRPEVLEKEGLSAALAKQVEALEIRHKIKADHVKVCLKHSEKDVSLIIRDNGIGFDTNQEFTGHLGLKTMRERATSLGGQFSVASKLGEGTTLSINLAGVHT